MKLSILDELNALTFESLRAPQFREKDFTCFKNQIATGILFVHEYYGAVADHFSIKEMQPFHRDGKHVADVPLDGDTIHYLVDSDSIALSPEATRKLCLGLRYKEQGSFPTYIVGASFAMEDTILLASVSAAYSSYRAKRDGLIHVPWEEFDPFYIEDDKAQALRHAIDTYQIRPL